MKRLRHFLSSMVGRLFVILLLGMSVAAIGATMLATSKRQQEFERQNLNRIADRLQGYVNLLDGNPELRERLLEIGGPSVRALQPGARLGRADTALMEVWMTGPARCRARMCTSPRSVPAFPSCRICCRHRRRGTDGIRVSAIRPSFRPSAARSM